MSKEEETIAVVGGGISGLATAWLLERQGKKVTLFEAEATCGGHALTVDTTEFGPVDLGFQVCNLTTYPHLMGFLAALGIETEPSDMSFALSTPTLEWGSRGLEAVFAEPGSNSNPRFLYMLYEVIRFGQQAPEVLEPGSTDKWAKVTLGDYLKERGYSEFFSAHYVVPMCAAIWSCSDADALAFPVTRLVAFWKNHHLLSILERPVWRVVKGRSRAYVERVAGQLREVRVSSKVISARRRLDGGVSITVETAGGSSAPERFDHVVFATHADVTRKILGTHAKAEEAAALEAVRYQSNEVYLHTDERLMPRKRSAWASWNCVQDSDSKSRDSLVCVSYWINLLQNLPEGSRDLFVTLNPPSPPDERLTLNKFSLGHPLFDARAVEAQARLTSDLQGVGGVWYAGAWCGYGFHEDGIRSAVQLCRRLCQSESVTPWGEGVVCSPRMGLSQRFFLGLFTRFAGAVLPDEYGVRLILPTGDEVMMGGSHAKPSHVAAVHCADAGMFQRVVLRSDIGLGDAYMDGLYDCGGGGDGLYKLLDVLCHGGANADEESYSRISGALGVLGSGLHSLYRKLELAAHQRNSNTEEGSARNISYHYDAGNDFYATFLDPTMLYSSAIFPDRQMLEKGCLGGEAFLGGIDLSGEEAEKELEKAQYAKIDSLIANAKVGAGDRVLEIGCGWGACAVRMAQLGASVVAITVSNEQLKAARERVKKAGVSHLVSVEFCDYRKAHERFGTFDKVLSCEMLEAVGHEHLHSFFETVSVCLKPMGIASIQVITLPDERYEAYCNKHSDFIRTYIFPGGHLPCLAAMNQISSENGLSVERCVDIGLDYALTLRLWRERMLSKRAQIRAMGYPERFIRMYEFYFAYCEAAFANLLIYDYQIAWRKSPLPRPDVPARIRARTRAEAGGDGRAAAIDPLTGVLLAVWLCLTGLLVATKPPIAIIPATIGGFIGLRATIASLLDIPDEKARMATALLAALVSFAGAASVLLHGLALVDGELHTFTQALLSPPHVTDAALLPGCRLVVGTAAGFAALRAWECCHTRHRVLEGLTYAGVLICYVAALYHEGYLLALCTGQLSELHSAMLRLRSIKRHGGRLGGEGVLWGLSWFTYWSLRVLPHALLLTLFGSHAGTLPPMARVPIVGLCMLALTNVLIGVNMWHAQNADERAASLAAQGGGAQHQQGATLSINKPGAGEAAGGGGGGAAIGWSPLRGCQPTKQTCLPLHTPSILASVGSLLCWGYVTSAQEPPTRAIILGTTAAYGALYGLLKLSGLMQPSGLLPRGGKFDAGRLSGIEAAGWRERILSTVNAVVLTYGAVLCFAEWPSYSPREAFVSDHLWSHPVTFASIFVGYLQWDLAWILWHYRSGPDAASVVHHLLFSAISHYVLWGWYFKRPYAWLSICEISTPFLNLRVFLAMRHMKRSRLYTLASALFALTFLATRVVGYSLGVADLWLHYDQWRDAKAGLYAVVAGTHAGLLLNLFWSRGVLNSLVRALR